MKTAKIISVIGHPIFLPTWMMVIMLLSGLTRFMPGNDWFFLSATFSMTCLIPAVMIAIMKKWNIIKSIEMDSREDRLGPLFIMIMFIYATIRFFSKIELFSVFNFYLTAILVVTILAFILTFFWKISLHTLGWGSFVACLFIMSTAAMRLYLPYLIASIICTGIVASSRLKLKSHSNAQIYTGFAMGFSTVIIMYFFFLF